MVKSARSLAILFTLLALWATWSMHYLRAKWSHHRASVENLLGVYRTKNLQATLGAALEGQSQVSSGQGSAASAPAAQDEWGQRDSSLHHNPLHTERKAAGQRKASALQGMDHIQRASVMAQNKVRVSTVGGS